jgi:hypothetical protein
LSEAMPIPSDAPPRSPDVIWPLHAMPIARLLLP